MPREDALNRRGFLLGCLALGAAPAIVRASSLMPARVLEPSPILLDGTIRRYAGFDFVVVRGPVIWFSGAVDPASFAAPTLRLEDLRRARDILLANDMPGPYRALVTPRQFEALLGPP